jgi:hypothetical protein
MEKRNELRWYKRQNCDFAIEVISPASILGRVVNVSDGGLLIAVFPEDEALLPKMDSLIEMIIDVHDDFHLSRRQKVEGHVRRLVQDPDTSSWYVGIEVVGAWEDL